MPYSLKQSELEKKENILSPMYVEERLEAFEMWLYRRILRISWKDKVTNVIVLERMNKEREVMNTVKKRKLEYFGHIMRNEKKYDLLITILQGKVYGKQGPGRRRISWLKNNNTNI